MAQQIKQFLQYLTVEKNASSHTVTSYLADIESFFEFAKRQGVSEALFGNANNILVRAYLGELKAKGSASTTIARRIASLRSFYRFLVLKNLIDYNPMSGIKAPKCERKTPVFLDDAEIKHLLALPDSSILGQRNAAILELLYATGIRLSELVGLNIDDVDLFNRYILVYGSGVKERVLPIGRKAANAIEKYIIDARKRLCCMHPDINKLFLNRYGGELTERSIRRIIAKYINMFAAAKNASPRVIRNSFALQLLNNGADIRSVQEIMGYVNLSPVLFFEDNGQEERLRIVYKNAHPRA